MAGYDSAIAYWATQDPADVPALLRQSATLKVVETETRGRDPQWFAGHAPAIAASARAALRANPLDASSIRELGELAVLRKSGDGLAQYRLAERVTRRDIIAQFHLINASAERSDIDEALTHYDRILTIAPETYDTLFTALAAAADTPVVSSALPRYAGRDWYRRFVETALDMGAAPGTVTRLAEAALPKLAAPQARTLSGHILRKLIARREMAAATRFVQTMPGFDNRVLRDIGFSDTTVDEAFAPLSWTLANDDAVETELTGNRELAIRVSPARSATAAERMTLLAPGTYTLSGELAYAESEPGAVLNWTLRCSDGSAILDQQTPATPGQVAVSSAFVVPVNCPAQTWQIRAKAAETQFTSIATIRRLSIRLN